MKSRYTFFLLIMSFAVISANQVSGQGRGRDRSGDREPANRGQSNNGGRRDHYEHRDQNNNPGNRDHDRNNSDRYSNNNRNNDHHNSSDRYSYENRHDNGNHYDRDRYYDRRPVAHYAYHQHDRYCGHQRVVVHHYSRPRYVYYRDYDVYYDYTRNVYFSWSGRAWTMNIGVPVFMRTVNLRNARRYEVKYYDDDFAGYLDRGRPEYGDQCNW